MNILLQILIALRTVHPLLAPHATLLAQVRIVLPSNPTDADIEKELHLAESRKWVVGITDELTGRARWKITDLGMAVLSEHGV